MHGFMKVIREEKMSKTNNGRLKRRTMQAKVVEHIEDPLDQRSCIFFVCLYVSKWLVYYSNTNYKCACVT